MSAAAAAVVVDGGGVVDDSEGGGEELGPKGLCEVCGRSFHWLVYSPRSTSMKTANVYKCPLQC